MITTIASTTISTAAASTSRAVSSAEPLASTPGSLNARHLAITSLAEPNDAAGLLTWVNREYLVPLEHTQEPVGGLNSEARVLEIDGRRRLPYALTYFDTPGLEVFMLTARKRYRRFKTRVRTYLNSGLCLLEIKTRGVYGITVKRRIGYHPGDVFCLTSSSRVFVAACLTNVGITGPAAARDVTAALRPVLAATYERTTLHLPRAETRITIDTAPTWQRLTPGSHARTTAVAGAPQTLRPAYPTAAVDDGRPVTVAGIAVIETESPATSSPAGRASQDVGHQPAHILKYATGMAPFHPELPANRWYRALTYELADLFGTDHSNLENIGITCANVGTT